MIRGLLKVLLLAWMVSVVYQWAWVLFLGGEGADEPEASRLFVGYQYVQMTISQLLPEGWVPLSPAYQVDFVNKNRWYFLKGFAYPIILGTVILVALSKKCGGFFKCFGASILALSASALAFLELGRITYNLTRNMAPNEDHVQY